MSFYAVYSCGATDCFLHAVFASNIEAVKYAHENSLNPEGYLIKEWSKDSDIDLTDTGFNFNHGSVIAHILSEVSEDTRGWAG